MQEELTALEAINTWELVPRTTNMNIIGTKWVFNVKYKVDNTIERLKKQGLLLRVIVNKKGLII